jgi:hypothetical protein
MPQHTAAGTQCNRQESGAAPPKAGGFTERRVYLIVRVLVGRYSYAGMIKAVLLLLEPVRTWDQIALAERSVRMIFVIYVLPLLLLTSVAEAYGMMRWGDWRGEPLAIRQFSLHEAVGFQLVQLTVNFLIVFLGAKMVKNLGETFHGRHSYQQAFTAVAYGLGPFWTLRLLDAFPSVSPWATFIMGMVLTTVVLYHGIPRCMLPDPPQAFGLYIVGSLILALTAGLGRFLVWWLQQGRFKGLEDILNRAVSAVLPG